MLAFLNLISKGAVNVKPLISKVFRIEEAEKAYETLSGDVVGVLFKYRKEKVKTKGISLRPVPRKKDKINVALIGAGSFAKSFHLPNLKRIKDYRIYAIVSATPKNTKQIAEQYGAAYATTDFREVLKDKNVDLVLISTRHNLHASMSMEAAKAEKDVFVEKPMAMNENEMNEIIKIIQKSKVNYMVGFNRRFSPFSIRAKELLDKREGPMIINYMVNAGPLPPDHWIYDPKEGGGRIIGECCHFFDLFNYFINSEPTKIAANSISAGKKTRDEDNIVVNIKYKDGSLANLIYNTISSEEIPKERIEIVRGGSTLIIEDFKKLEVFGFKERGFSSKQDKGHFNELMEFANTIKGKPSQKISLEECAAATKISFEVAQIIRGG
jgi:predicted dehydrogenase